MLKILQVLWGVLEVRSRGAWHTAGLASPAFERLTVQLAGVWRHKPQCVCVCVHTRVCGWGIQGCV